MYSSLIADAADDASVITSLIGIIDPTSFCIWYLRKVNNGEEGDEEAEENAAAASNKQSKVP